MYFCMGWVGVSLSGRYGCVFENYRWACLSVRCMGVSSSGTDGCVFLHGTGWHVYLHGTGGCVFECGRLVSL